MKTPASILFDVTGIPTAVSASTQPLSGALGHVMAGFDATNSVRYAKFDSDSLKVTGSVAISDGGSSITVDGSVTALGDNAVALQQDANNKLIVIDTDVSGAINDTKLTLSSSLSQIYSELNSLGTLNNPVIISPTTYGKTAFGEQRVALPFALADLINKYEITPTEYSTLTGSSGVASISHVPAESAIKLQVDGTSGSLGKLRTNTFYRYSAGKGQNIKMTLYHNDSGQSNQVRRWGYFDDSDGLFFQLSGSNLSIVERKSTTGAVTEINHPQSTWNVDKLNGTGASGVTIDVTKSQIYELRFQWLGVGFADFYINGIHTHNIPHANLISGPYMKTGQLPLSWDVENNLSSSTGAMTTVCASVISENGEPPPEYSYAAFNSTAISVSTTEIPVLSIRPKSTYNGITNRIITLPKKAVVSTEGARISFRIIANTVLTGASWSSVATTSGTEFDVSSTSFTGGETLYYGFLPGSNDAETVELEKFFSILARKLRQNAFATAVDSLTIVAKNEAAGSTNVRSAIVFTEVR